MFRNMVYCLFYALIITHLSTAIPLADHNQNVTQPTVTTAISIESHQQKSQNQTTPVTDLKASSREETPKLLSPQSKRLPDATAHNHKPETIIDRLTLDELRQKCQHFSKLFGVSTTEKPSNLRYGDYNTRRPVYVPNKPLYNHQKYVGNTKHNGFYITQLPTKPPQIISSSVKPTTTTAPPDQNVKYIRLEPVILQKTILTDGRVVYYWHKSLPTTVEFSNTQNVVTQDVTEPTSTTTTSTTEYSYIGNPFRNFLPFYGSYTEEQDNEQPTTTTSTTTPPTTSTRKPTNDDISYSQQLRFVVPVPYDRLDTEAVRQPWDFDHFAYYPKALQPSAINVRVPYTPTFHVIKSLAVANVDEKSKEALDDVSVQK